MMHHDHRLRCFNNGRITLLLTIIHLSFMHADGWHVLQLNIVRWERTEARERDPVCQSVLCGWRGFSKVEHTHTGEVCSS